MHGLQLCAFFFLLLVNCLFVCKHYCESLKRCVLMKEVVGQSVWPYLFFSLYRSHVWPHGDIQGYALSFFPGPSSLAYCTRNITL